VTSRSPPEPALFNVLPHEAPRNETHDTPEQPYRTSLQLRQVTITACQQRCQYSNKSCSSRLQNSIGPSTTTRAHRAPPGLACAVPQTSSAPGPSSLSSPASSASPTHSLIPALAPAPSHATPSSSSPIRPSASPDAPPRRLGSSSRKPSASRTRSLPTWWRKTSS